MGNIILKNYLIIGIHQEPIFRILKETIILQPENSCQ